MNVRIARARIVGAVLAGLLAVSPATPVAAADPVSWVEAACATGAITDYAGVLDDRGAHRVSVGGWIQPCDQPDPAARFATVLYYSTGTVPLTFPEKLGATGLYPYQPLPAQTPFAFDYVLVSTGAAGVYGRLTALCIASGRQAPVACVAVDHPNPSSAPAVTPIPTTDQRITSAPPIRPNQPRPWPTCGNCV